MKTITLQQIEKLYQQALEENQNPEIRGTYKEDVLRGKINALKEIMSMFE